MTKIKFLFSFRLVYANLWNFIKFIFFSWPNWDKIHYKALTILQFGDKRETN